MLLHLLILKIQPQKLLFDVHPVHRPPPGPSLDVVALRLLPLIAVPVLVKKLLQYADRAVGQRGRALVLQRPLQLSQHLRLRAPGPELHGHTHRRLQGLLLVGEGLAVDVRREQSSPVFHNISGIAFIPSVLGPLPIAQFDPRLFKFALQSLILLAETLNHNLFVIAVHHRGILNIASFLGIVERLRCLLVVGVRRGDASDHQTVGVAAQRLLQDRSQLTLSVGDVLQGGCTIRGKSSYTLAQDH